MFYKHKFSADLHGPLVENLYGRRLSGFTIIFSPSNFNSRKAKYFLWNNMQQRIIHNKTKNMY